MKINTPSYEALLPALYTLIGGGIALFGQWRIFKLNEKKEEKKEIGKLYGEFVLNAKDYLNAYIELAQTTLHHIVLLKLIKFYEDDILVATAHDKKKTLATMLEELYKRDDKLVADIIKFNEKYVNYKHRSHSQLYQIHFILRNKQLYDLIEQFEDEELYDEVRNESAELVDLENNTFYNKVDKQYLQPQIDRLSKIGNSIQDLLIRIS